MSRWPTATIFFLLPLLLLLTRTAPSEATCGSCNERLKVSIICCLFEGKCCVLGPVAIGKRDVTSVLQRHQWSDDVDSDVNNRIVHPHARPRWPDLTFSPLFFFILNLKMGLFFSAGLLFCGFYVFVYCFALFSQEGTLSFKSKMIAQCNCISTLTNDEIQ